MYVIIQQVEMDMLGIDSVKHINAKNMEYRSVMKQLKDDRKKKR